jgi:flagellar biosynthesis/type III secretory pathway protein FliH
MNLTETQALRQKLSEMTERDFEEWLEGKNNPAWNVGYDAGYDDGQSDIAADISSAREEGYEAGYGEGCEATQSKFGEDY